MSEASFLQRLEAHFGFRSRYGFDPPEVLRDRADHRIRHASAAVSIDVGFFGVETIRRVWIAVVPEDRAASFSLTDAISAYDPSRRVPALPEAPTEAQLDAWLDAHARFFHDHADALLNAPVEVFQRVRSAAEPGDRGKALVDLCCELWPLHDYDPPTVIHWRHECELSFRKDALHLEVRLEDHEHAGVAEPFTVPEIELVDDESGASLPLLRIMEAIDPEHLATRPTATSYAMSLQRLRPFLEHTGAFIDAHPEVLADARVLRELSSEIRSGLEG